MNIRIEVVCSDANSNEQQHEVLTIKREELAMENTGHESEQGQSAAGRRSGFRDRATGVRISGAATDLSWLRPAAHEHVFPPLLPPVVGKFCCMLGKIVGGPQTALYVTLSTDITSGAFGSVSPFTPANTMYTETVAKDPVYPVLIYAATPGWTWPYL